MTLRCHEARAWRPSITANQTLGATKVEAADLYDVIAFAQSFELTEPMTLGPIANFAASVLTGVGTNA